MAEIVYNLILFYLSINVVYVLLFAMASLRKGKQKCSPGETDYHHSIAVLIPAHKEDAVIVESARLALRQAYPADRYDVIVIADHLQPSTLAQLRSLPIQLIEVNFVRSTKALALNTAMQQLPGHDIAVVLDADNTMDAHFLSKINTSYGRGQHAIQGHRVEKNDQGDIALLDAISEGINTSIFRKGHIHLGLSSALIGSGMAFDYELFKQEMCQIDAIGGFDKELELRLLRKGVTIHFLEDARVFDEKVTQQESFKNQRTRWIYAQFRYGLLSIVQATRMLLRRGNLDYFDKSFQFLLMPRLISLGMLILLTLWGLYLGDLRPASLLIMFVGGLLLALPRRFFNRHMLRAVFRLPALLISMLQALVQLRKARTNFCTHLITSCTRNHENRN